LPVRQVRTLAQVVARENQGGRVLSILIGSFGSAAFQLAQPRPTFALPTRTPHRMLTSA